MKNQINEKKVIEMNFVAGGPVGEMKVINCTNYQAEQIELIKNSIHGQLLKRLDIIQVGTRADSDAYIKQKIVQGKKAGCMVVVHRFSFPDDLSSLTKVNSIISLIQDLNKNHLVHGIIVQLPMDDKFITKRKERDIIDAIDPIKDVDCLTTTNLGKLYSGYPLFVPCTPAGIIEIFDNLNEFLGTNEKRYNDYVKGKKVLIIGRSHIVGKPLSFLLTDMNGTVTMAHSHTPNLKESLWDYDIIISAAGVKNLIDREDFLRLNELNPVTPKAIIDVSINRDEEGLCGDVCRELFVDKELQKNIDFVTATPGGVGRMTVLSLIRNLYRAKREQDKNSVG